MASLGLIVAYLDPTADIDEEFNDWYEMEHIPERLAVPGFVTARRGQRTEHPAYMATYDLESVAALQSEAYLNVSGDNRSPWTARMLRRTRTFGRLVYEQLVPGRELINHDHAFSVLRHLPDENRAAVEAHVLEAREHPGVSARLFVTTEKSPAQLLLYYTAADAAAARWCADQAVGGDVEQFEVPAGLSEAATKFKYRRP